MYTEKYNRIEIAKLLLEKGADVNVIDKNGLSALKWALYNGKIDMVKLLKQNGATE